MKPKTRNSSNKSNVKYSMEEGTDLNSRKTISRRFFIHTAGIGAVALGLNQIGCKRTQKAAEIPGIQGFERPSSDQETLKSWVPFSNRKIRVGIVGYGVCKFGADFGSQNHPNVEVVAVSDLFTDRCAELAKVCGCSKTLNLTVAGIVAHQSAFKNGELMKISQYSF
jgi:hypothetical protein